MNACELWRSGYRVKLQSQPFKVLALLLEHPGEIVTREELQLRLWGDNTTVDFDHSLATAINKIREALRDSAENPRFVETLARRGYRFIAPTHRVAEADGAKLSPASPAEKHGALTHFSSSVVEAAPGPLIGPDSPTAPDLPVALGGTTPVHSQDVLWPLPPLPSPAASVQLPAVAGPSSIREKARAGLSPAFWSVAALLGLLVGLAAYLLGRGQTETRPPHIVQLTHSGRLAVDIGLTENLPASSTDAYRIFVPIVHEGRAGIGTVPVGGGEPTPLRIPDEVASPTLGDVSPDGSRLLLRSHLSTESEQPLWVVPTTGGSALRVGGVLAHDATWMPDGKGILYAAGNELYLTHADDARQSPFASLPGRAFWLRWNPAGTLLRFTIIDPIVHTGSLWQMSATDRKPRQILTGFMNPPMECCGVWTADGTSFVFQAERGGNTDVWRLSGDAATKPVRLTDGPLQFQAPVAARTGNTVFFLGADGRSQVKRLTATGELVPEKGFLASAFRVEFSRDRRWVAWTDDRGRLWRAAGDGTQTLQLTPDTLDVFLARWAPDGSQLAFMAREPGKAWRLYLVAADGREIHSLLTESRNAADPSWSPDGQLLVFGRINDTLGKETAARTLQILNLRTNEVSEVPGSDGLFSPRWSPNGRYIAALSLDQRQVLLFDVAAKQWRPLPVHSGADPAWSSDSRFLYLHEPLDPAQPIDRVSIPEGRVQQLIRLSFSPESEAAGYIFGGLTQDDQPLIVERTFTANLYSLLLR